MKIEDRLTGNLALFTYSAVFLYVLFFIKSLISINYFSYFLIASTISLSILLFKKTIQNEKMQYKISHDNLTDLYSRDVFNEEIEKLINEKRDIAVLFIDLDGFKQVNDTLGHGVGDFLLVSAASRIKRSVRPFDKAFRLGGDELAVIITNLNCVNKVHICTEIAERIIKQVGRPYCVNSKVAKVTCSVGIAFSNSRTSHKELVKAADSAMYEAKTNGKNKFIIYEESTAKAI